MTHGIRINLKYSMDTSAILHAWQWYIADVFLDVWARLDDLIKQGIIIASEEVLHELEVKHDAVWEWARERDMFVPTDEDIQRRVTEIESDYPRLVEERSEWPGADPFVIALAQIESCTVVTGERHGTAARPRIPDVCDALGIRCIDIRQLFRDQGWKF